MMIFLEEGYNVIKPSVKYENKKGCGIIPIGNKVEHIKTKGLLHNIGNTEDRIRYLDFKEYISTSNQIVD